MTAIRSEPVRLSVLHPQRAWCDALEYLLQGRPEVEVVLAHINFEWVRAAVTGGDVDLVLLAVDDGGFAADHVQQLREAWPGLDVVVISDSTDVDLITATVRAGARGWLRSVTSARELVDTVQGVARGETWLPPDLTTVVLEHLLTVERARVVSRDAMAALSNRELEILECLAQGLTRRQIAERYTLSLHTVRTHISNVLRKLDVHSTLAAVSIVRKASLSEERTAGTAARVVRPG